MLASSSGLLLAAGLRSSERTLPRALVAGSATPTSSLHLVRPQDMLVLDFDFYNLAPTFDTDPPQLRRVDSSVLAYVVARTTAFPRGTGPSSTARSARFFTPADGGHGAAAGLHRTTSCLVSAMVRVV
ncbi:hypothetical protein [Actinoallomurus iriomotensis]|uniref:Uncharacterized protein n=1 Tax=Actinoallomurus iriomotensis TaxID=478107 RepID=A0A9W6VSL4_9ACTN|nr:hypothetical protein [Actinoallomurus iriomotensis]GLY83498.1 hypothetical protein Airi02_014280 [Actinoallomurus iriomotensis]